MKVIFYLHYFNCIQKSGHSFCNQGYPEVMYGTLVGVLAVNPASCSIGGIKESCSAYRPCQQCNILLREISLKVIICLGDN